MPLMTPLAKLFEPVRVGSLSLPNRLVMPPMVTNLATEDGYVTTAVKDHYEVRARGGVGLIIVEATCVQAPVGKLSHRQLVIDNDRFLPGLRELADAIKRGGAHAAIQVHHAGRNTSTSVIGTQPVAPSPIPLGRGEVPRELTREEIDDLTVRFVRAAQRARDAGFEGVELHAAHGYLMAQFLSGAANQRTDEYGGELVNRARFVLETFAAVRQALGRDFPVWVRVSGREYGLPGGTTIEETQALAQMLERAGADAIHVSALAHDLDPRALPPMAQPPGNLVRFAEAVKRVVNVPVIAVGRLDPVTGEAALQEGRADLIAVGRGLLADPELPRKACEGRLGDIVPCLACGTCQDGIQLPDARLRCRVNPAAGRERAFDMRPAAERCRVVVVGGGPAGMETARVAALRGHDVVLFEKAPALGGQLGVAAVPPYKQGLAALARYLAGQLANTGVDVRLGREVTAADIEALVPDAVVLATGVCPLVPAIPGIERTRLAHAEDVLSGRAQVGERVVVLGGELVGCETAEFLADRGKEVTITRRGPRLATKVVRAIGVPLVERLRKKGVRMLTGVRYEGIGESGVTLITAEGQRETIPADTIVLAAGSEPSAGLWEALWGKVPELHRVGDCVEPRSVLEALVEGRRAGCLL